MADQQDRDTLAIVVAITQATEKLATYDDRLMAIEIAWLALASTARAEALAIPDAFPAVRARQVEHLERMALLVRDDEPDLEAERLTQENDVEGLLRHLKTQRDKAGE